MPATEFRGSFLSRLSIRRNQVISMDGNHEQELEDLELFQKHVADLFSDLITPSDDQSPSDPLLSVAWLRKLLDAFLSCEAQFKITVAPPRNLSQISKPPLDRLLPELLDRVVKSLDVCNAVIHGVEAVRQFQKLAEIAVSALEKQPIGNGQVKRARKALSSLISSMAAEDRDIGSTKSTERTWSLGYRQKDRSPAEFRSLSLSMAKGWSAARQIQEISSNLVAPHGGEASGLATPVCIMSTVLAFVMWTLVSAIPCQERTELSTQFPAARHLSWVQPIINVQEKIADEWKKKGKKGTSGLMEELQRIEKLSRSLMESTDSFTFPSAGERLGEIAEAARALGETCRKMDEGLVPLQQQIREVFHRIVKTRTEMLELMEQSGKVEAPIV